MYSLVNVGVYIVTSWSGGITNIYTMISKSQNITTIPQTKNILYQKTSSSDRHGGVASDRGPVFDNDSVYDRFVVKHCILQAKLSRPSDKDAL